MSNPIHLSPGLLKRSGTCGLAISRDSEGVVIPVCTDGTLVVRMPRYQPLTSLLSGLNGTTASHASSICGTPYYSIIWNHQVDLLHFERYAMLRFARMTNCIMLLRVF